MVCLLGFLWNGATAHANEVILDDFEDVSDWRITTSEGVNLEIAQDEGHTGMGMRLDFDFHGRGGFVIARKDLSLRLPEDHAFSFHLRARAPANNLEFKLVDRNSKPNIWWWKQQDYEFPNDWKKITIKDRHFEFAWGPSGGDALTEVAAIEFAITAGVEDGKGSVWIDDLRFEERVTISQMDTVPLATASTTANGHEPAWLFDKNPKTTWKSGAVAEQQWFQTDFRDKLEYGGLIIDWDDDDYAQSYWPGVRGNGITSRIFAIPVA